VLVKTPFTDRTAGADLGFLRTTLVRSPIGTSAHTHRVLQGLGHNGKMGRSRVHRNEPGIRGAIRKTRHLLGVELVLPGQEVVPMKPTPYSVLDRPALRVTGPDAQYALSETYEGYYSLRWTTTLPAPKVFNEFSPHVDPDYPFDIHIDGSGGRKSFVHEPDRTRKSAVLDQAREEIKAPGVVHFVLDYARGSLHWENVTGSAFHEVGILSPELGRDTFRTLVRVLGTPAISDAVDQLVDQFEFVWA